MSNGVAATPSAQYSLTIRVEIEHRPGMLGEVATAIGRAGGTIGSIDLVRVDDHHTLRDITVDTGGPAHPYPVKPVGAVQIVGRADDPGSGLPWATRRFTVREHHRNGKTYTYPCLQLGRLNGSTFGWVTPGAPFRTAAFDLADVPSLCGVNHFRLGLPLLQALTLTTDPAGSAPVPATTVVWGALPPDVASARLADGTTLNPARHGEVLLALPGRPVGEPVLRGTLRLRSGATRAFDLARISGRGVRHPKLHGQHVAVRVPDPAGGAPWGIVVGHDSHGALCLGFPNRLVGDRVASVDGRLGTAMTNLIVGDLRCPAGRTPTAAHPIRADASVFATNDEDPVGTIQLRRLTGRVVVYARTTPDVRTVTVTTSRDVRTLVPDPETHLVIAVYDGTFPGERAKLTAHLSDGRVATVMQTVS